MIFLINDLSTGGAEWAMVNYVNNLRQIRPVVALLDPALELLGELDPSIEVVSLLGGATPLSTPVLAERPGQRRGQPRGQMLLELPKLYAKAWRLSRLCRRNGTVTVSTFLNRSHTIALAAKWLFEPRLRVIINVHETLSQHLTIHFGSVERRLMHGFIRMNFPRAARVIAVCNSVREDLVENLGLPRERITVVFNPLDLTRIRRGGDERTRPAASDGPAVARIVAVGRLVHLKGFDLLIRAVARLPLALGARLEIVGEGEERQALEALIEESGLQGRARLIGNQRNPWQFIAGADILALGSRTEAFPNVIGEAFALSRPVVATLCSDGIREYLDGGRCGLLVPPDDVGAMAAALERLLTDRELRLALVREGASRIEAFDLPRAVETYERILAEVVRA